MSPYILWKAKERQAPPAASIHAQIPPNKSHSHKQTGNWQINYLWGNSCLILTTVHIKWLEPIGHEWRDRERKGKTRGHPRHRYYDPV